MAGHHQSPCVQQQLREVVGGSCGRVVEAWLDNQLQLAEIEPRSLAAWTGENPPDDHTPPAPLISLSRAYRLPKSMSSSTN
jgi:hypothetical protein